MMIVDDDLLLRIGLVIEFLFDLRILAERKEEKEKREIKKSKPVLLF